MKRSVAASCHSHIQPTGNNSSLIPIYIILPSGFSEGYCVSFPAVVLFLFSMVEEKYANSVDVVVVAVEPVTTTVAAVWDFGLSQLSDVGKG